MMVDIAANQKHGKVKIRDMSARQDISQKYLEQIITLLNKNDMVKGERGPQGGYVLTRPASEITVAEVVDVMEGLAPVPCIKADGVDCERKGVCTTIGMWERIGEAVRKIMSETTIQDLVDEAVAKGIIRIGTSMPEYVIRCGRSEKGSWSGSAGRSLLAVV